MSQGAAPAAAVSRNAVNFARALTVATRTWGFYPPEHPAVALAVDRLIAAAAEAVSAGLLQLAVTPHALLLDGNVLEAPDLSVSECAALLHDRDILQISLVSPPDDAVVRAWLGLLSLDRATRRERGGPEKIWAAEGHTSLLVEQIDYQEILEREFDEGVARRDLTWKAIVRSIIVGRRAFTLEEQERLLAISRDVGAIGELCKDTKEAFSTPDGSPLLTTQAATVLAVFRHLAATASALEPQRAAEVTDAITMAASALDPSVACELLQQDDGPGNPLPMVAAIRRSFDDQQIALLLARAVAAQGHVTHRLGQVFGTLAPDETRRKRVLTVAKRLITERDFGSQRPIDDLRQSLDQLLLKYDESEYVSDAYRQSVDQAAAQAAILAAQDLPPEMTEWLETLGHENVRRVSGQLLIDLLRNETDAERMSDVARDIGVFAEELLLAGAFEEAVPLLEALRTAAAGKLAPEQCASALQTVAASTALSEVSAAIADQTGDEFAKFSKLITLLGAPAVPSLLAGYRRESEAAGIERTTALIVALGAAAIPPIAEAVGDPRWLVQAELAKALGRIGTAAAVPPLQTLVRSGDARVLRAAVAALAGINDASAARSLHTVLRASSGDARAVIIAALVKLGDARVVPLLARVLQECQPFGDEYGIVLDTFGALAVLRDDRAVPPIVQIARQRRWLSWGKTMQLRRSAIQALVRIGTARSQDALADLARTGDFFLRRLARRRLKAQGSA